MTRIFFCVKVRAVRKVKQEEEEAKMIESFNYGLLRQKIKDEFKTLENFATAMGTNQSQISKMMNGKSEWTSTSIMKAAKLLGITGEIGTYFFTLKVR